MMLANFFGKSKPINFILITGLFLGYYLLFFLKFDLLAVPSQPILEFFKGVLFFLVAFFIYNFIITKNNLTRDNTFAFLFFVISLGLIPAITFLDKRLYVHLILLLLLRKIYSLRNGKAIYKKLFDAGLWLGVSFLIEPAAFVFVLLLYLAVFLYYKPTIRSLIIPLVGFITSIILYFGYCFFTDQLIFFYKLFIINFTIDFNLYATPHYTVTFAVLFLLTFIAIISRSGAVFSINNKFKRSWVLLLFHVGLGILYALLTPKKNGTELIAVFIPMSIIIANWLQFVKRKWLIDIILLLLLGYSFAIQFIV